MSDMQGAKAISLVSQGKIREIPTRTFAAEGSTGGVHYEPTLHLETGKWSCTCQAGHAGKLCYHVRAARLLLRAEQELIHGVQAVTPLVEPRS